MLNGVRKRLQIIMNFCNICKFTIVIPFIISCDGSIKSDLILSDYCVNLGDVKEGITISGKVKLFNKGRTDLLIKRIDTDCGCTLATIDKMKIESNDSACIYYSINTTNKLGNIENFVFIESNTDSILHFIQLKANVLK